MPTTRQALRSTEANAMRLSISWRPTLCCRVELVLPVLLQGFWRCSGVTMRWNRVVLTTRAVFPLRVLLDPADPLQFRPGNTEYPLAKTAFLDIDPLVRANRRGSKSKPRAG